MKRYLLPVMLISISTSCHQDTAKTELKTDKQISVNRIYSTNVADSFSIFIHLPAGYDKNPGKYPVVYLLDANFYFGIMSPTLDTYSEVGLTPSVILVGIGYKNLEIMDSLRDRDYTYPQALPKQEMTVSGGANKFLSFLTNELIPQIDKQYKTDTADRILFGHSLGGYFTAYALLQNLSGKNNAFNYYIAASPSFDYNNYYLLDQFKNAPKQDDQNKKTRAYFSFGGLEDADTTEPGLIKSDQLLTQLSKSFPGKQPGVLQYKSDIYSNLDHMDTPIPTFIKGLQWYINNYK